MFNENNLIEQCISAVENTIHKFLAPIKITTLKTMTVLDLRNGLIIETAKKN